MNGINTRRNVLKNILIIVLNIIFPEGIFKHRSLRRAGMDSTESNGGCVHFANIVADSDKDKHGPRTGSCVFHR
jgi:hypothetical protein